jgi:YebC/PmpR family DNA-binding regulatory protein
MSGHSKWSTIKRQKGVTDQKRGAVFTKLSNAITMSVKQGGGVANPDDNPRLRLAVEAARAANMPKDNIERAIARAAGKDAKSLEEVVYEGFGPGGFSIIVEAVTDNKQRTTPVVKSIFDKNGGRIGNQGSVAYQFRQKGQVVVIKNGVSLDEVFLSAAEAGADDVEDAGQEVVIYTEPTELAKVKDALQKSGLSVSAALLVRQPTVTTPISDKSAAERALQFVERIEDIEDVQRVYANFDISDDLIQQLAA